MDEVLARVADPSLRAYVVWEPVLDGDDRAEAERASHELHDPRVTEYWDGRDALGLALGERLDLPSPRRHPEMPHGLAWDVYLVYDRDARWSSPPPQPAYWMHQLSSLRGAAVPFLDGEKLRAAVVERLETRAR